MNQRYQDFSIELDCPPGGIRPNDLIDGVLEETGLEAKDFETGAPFFGHQTWVLRASAGKDEIYKKVKYKIIKPRVEELYHRGWIRFGSW